MVIKNIDGIHRRDDRTEYQPVISVSAPESKPVEFQKFDKPKTKIISIGKIISFVITGIIVFSVSLYLSKLLFTKNDGTSLAEALSKINIFKQIARLITSDQKYLAGEKDDRINFLLLGIGGEGHDGPYLTDTIILASLRPSEKKVSLISIPRDMLVPIDQNNWQKINAVYTIGKNSADNGLTYAKEIIEKAFDLPIHYYYLLDFEGFEKIIDTLGGIDVTVDNSFTDYSYPLTADPPSWQTVSFTAGKQHMDGATALKFARSRHGNNGEGSDFARGRRQQKIILAVKNKTFSFETLIRPTRISGLFTMMDKYFQTNMQLWEVMKLYDLTKEIKNESVSNFVLDDGPNNYLYSSILPDGAFALLPKGGNFSSIQEFIKNTFQNTLTPSETATLEIYNGTKVTGLAGQSALTLQNLGFKIAKFQNAPSQDHQTTVIYDLTNGQKNKSLEIIKGQVGGYATTEVPNYLKEDLITQGNPAVDFIVILGQDQLIK